MRWRETSRCAQQSAGPPLLLHLLSRSLSGLRRTELHASECCLGQGWCGKVTRPGFSRLCPRRPAAYPHAWAVWRGQLLQALPLMTLWSVVSPHSCFHG